jgi:hypothetical protein
MEQAHNDAQTITVSPNEQLTMQPSIEETAQIVTPQTCPTCKGAAGSSAATLPNRGPAAPVYIYAAGHIYAHPRNESVHKEYAQAVASIDTAGLNDNQVLKKVLSDDRFSYLVPQFCWLFTIGGQDTYFVQPRFSSDFKRLVEVLRHDPKPSDFDVIVGEKMGHLEYDGVTLPAVVVDIFYHSDMEKFLENIPKPDKVKEDAFKDAARAVFDRVRGIAENLGTTPGQRALVWAALREPSLYRVVAEAFMREESFSGVDVYPSPLSTSGNIIVLKISLTHRKTNVVTKYSMTIDCQGEFPYLRQALSQSL